MLSPTLVLAVAVALTPSLVRSQATTSEFTPKYYNIHIDASEMNTSDTFQGAVLMNMTVSTPTTYLLIHAQNLTLNLSSLVMMKKAMFFPRWDVQSITNLTEGQTSLNISFPSPLPPGDYSFYIEYQGSYQINMAGFAKVVYTANSEQKYLAVTGLEPTNARKVFPCYDVPAYRAQYRVEITVNRPHAAISSVKPTLIYNIVNTTKRVFVFDKYPAMPVHQLGWGVVDMTSYGVRENASSPTIVHTRAPLLYMSQTAWANQLTGRLVQVVSNYTGVQFVETVAMNFSKIEQIVLPEFFTGTSEAYGFVSFSEDSLLVAIDRSPTRYIQDVSLTLTRGVAQQWFGDIVSVSSWKDAWLMKGLDQFLQYVIAESMSEMSDWELADQAVVELTQPALALDSPTSHPLKPTTDDEAELIATAFDSLTKYKGGAIIRMLKDVFGSSFDGAINMFITTSFRNPDPYNPTTPTYFWTMMYGMAADSNVDLAQQSLEDIMQQWIIAPGYPVLSVSSNSSHFSISQSNASQWWVPVSYFVQTSPDIKRTWLQPGSSVTVEKTSTKWIVLNVNQTGYYRVNYSSDLWQELSNQLTTDLTQLPRLSRAQLIDDAFAMDPLMAVQFTSFLRAETDYFPWNTALRHYQALIYSMAGHSSYQLLQNYVLDLMNGVIAEIGLSSIQLTHVDKLKRSMVLEKACLFGDQTCIQKAVSNLRSWMAGAFYDQDLSPALLCAGVANSSTVLWHKVWDMFHQSIFPGVRMALLKSLTCTNDVDLLYEFLNNITSVSNPQVSFNDKTILLQTLATKPFGAHVLLHWLVDRLTAEVNSSTEASTPAPPSTTPGPLTTANPNASSTPSTVQTTNQAVETRQEASSIPRTMVPTEKLPESDVTTILDLILPALTTIDEGTKLDFFVEKLGNQTGFSNATLEAMRNASQKIYVQADHVMKLNAKLTVWLEAKAAATTATSPTGGSTKLPTQPPHTTAKPSNAPSLVPGATAFLMCLLVTWLSIPTMP